MLVHSKFVIHWLGQKNRIYVQRILSRPFNSGFISPLSRGTRLWVAICHCRLFSDVCLCPCSKSASQKAYSYYADDEFQHFYRWSSPVGIIKIMAILVIIMCVAIFACVASTLAWDVPGALSSYGVGDGYGGSYGGGYGSYGGGYNSFGGSSYGAGSYYGTVGGNYNDPRTAKGFIIAMAGIIFIACLVVFIIIVSHQSLSDSRKFYLAVAISSGILAGLMLIAAIVYLVAVNPMGQSNGSMYTMQIQGLCAQYQQPQSMGIMTNQYLYHYCVFEPQEVNMRFKSSSLAAHWLCCDPLIISGHCRRDGLPGRRRSDRDARLRHQDASENPDVRQKQHPVEEGEGHGQHDSTARCGGLGERSRSLWLLLRRKPCLLETLLPSSKLCDQQFKGHGSVCSSSNLPAVLPLCFSGCAKTVGLNCWLRDSQLGPNGLRSVG